MTIKFKYKQLPSQKEFHDDVTTPILMFSAGLGGGKTFALNLKMLQLSYLNKHIPGGYLVPDYPSFRKDVYPEMCEYLEKHKVKYKFHEKYNTWHFPWTRAPLYMFTGEKPIAGPNLAYCGINEFSLIRWIRVNEMLRRVRVKKAPYIQRALAGTPEDIHGWLEEFVEKQEESGRLKIIYGDTRDNYHLDDDYYDHLKSTLDPDALKVFATGAMIRIGGEYFYYAFDRGKNVDELVKYQPGQTIHACMDFNVGKMACSFAHKVQDEAHFFDEIYLTGDSDTPKMAMAIIHRYGKIDRDYTQDEWLELPLDERQHKLKHILVTCDASGKAKKTSGVSDVATLEKFGFKTRYRRSNPRLRDRQLLINGLFSKKKILINPKCKRLINDFKNVQQNKTDYTKVKDKDDKLTHFSDGADYFLDFEFNLNIYRTSTQRIL